MLITPNCIGLRGFLTLLTGAAVVFGTAYIIGVIHINVPISREIVGRTAPNLADLVNALTGTLPELTPRFHPS